MVERAIVKTISTNKARALQPQDIIAIVDSREQMPLDLSPLKTTTKGLKTGDYSAEGYEEKIAIERKSIQDFVACCGRERARFEKEIGRLHSYPYRAIIIEGDWSSVELKRYRGQIHPNAIIGSALGWALSDISIIMAGDRIRAGKMVARMLWIAINRISRGIK